MNPKIIIGAFIGVAILMIVALSGYLFQTNNSGFYQIKQAALSGEMTVHNIPGVYAQLFGDIFEYQVSDMYYFSKHDGEGGEGSEADPIKVRFNDGSTAEISGGLKFKLSQVDKEQLELHEHFKGYDAVKQDLIRQVVTEALMQTATLMKAEESYSTRRAEFTALAEDQIIKGIFETESKELKRQDVDGNEFIEKNSTLKLDKDGNPIIRKASSLARYKIGVLQFVIKDIDFDETINALISKKKEAEQAKVVARAKAEESKQDAISAEEKGKANVATARAEQLVEKIKATTIAEKEFEVSQFMKKKAEQDAQALLLTKKAEAEANNLLVQAGLTPLQRATIKKETAIGVAEQMAKLNFPKMMILGGSDGKAVDPFTAVGLESFMRISEKFADAKE